MLNCVTVMQLSMLKSVKNVDSFIMGCKKVGLDTVSAGRSVETYHLHISRNGSTVGLWNAHLFAPPLAHL